MKYKLYENDSFTGFPAVADVKHLGVDASPNIHQAKDIEQSLKQDSVLTLLTSRTSGFLKSIIRALGWNMVLVWSTQVPPRIQPRNSVSQGEYCLGQQRTFEISQKLFIHLHQFPAFCTMGSCDVGQVQGGFTASRTRASSEEAEEVIDFAMVLFPAALFPARCFS